MLQHIFKPEEAANYPVKWYDDIKTAVKSADIVMVLRVQNERHAGCLYPDAFEYKRQFEIDSKF